MTDTERIYIENDDFAAIRAGEPFRLFKYGTIYKSGKKHTISKENPFNLPHFQPPIKMGSHREDTPSGGNIVGLEYRDDGVYAVPQLNEEGTDVWNKKAYKYHSPEVIWENGYIEDPDTGEQIKGPLIVGVALTHTPHLGEQTALYSYSVEGNDNMSELTEVVEKNTTVIEKFMSLFERQPEPENEPEVQVDEFEAVQAERDDLKAQVQAYEAEKAQAELFSAIKAEFDTDEFGDAFKGISEEDGAIEMLASMTEEQRAWSLKTYKALSAQKDALTEELGEDNPLPASTEAFDAAVKAYAKEHEVSYADAYVIVSQESAELFQAYQEGK